MVELSDWLGDLVSESRTALSRRVAAGWARAESTATRLLLLAVFLVGLIAQFVKPVGDALEGKAYLGGALLSLVGYVLYTEVQKLNTAHESQRDSSEQLQETIRLLSGEIQNLASNQVPQPGADATMDDLMEQCRQRLQLGGDVHLWAMCFTGETFVNSLKRLLEGLPPDHERKVHVRILVPDFNQRIEVPGLLRDGKITDADGFRRHLVQKISRHERDLREMIGRMERKRQGTLKVKFHAMHMSPSLKLYLINDEQVFEGIYDRIELRPNEYGSALPAQPGSRTTDDQLLDLIGYDSLLTRWNRDDGERAREVIDRRRTLFDTFWEAGHDLATLSARSVDNDPERVV
ncbi:ATP/GTP-binding protein [Streptomyces sp. NPDC050508]|uniref:ATP/GTP-binding protein n=1 Tax=Streptomyces sp. NPDC050508 TaxID=3155405 RepID=UPI003443ECE0